MMYMYLICKGLFGCDEDTARVGGGGEHSEDGKLSTDGLTTASGGPHKHIFVSIVESIEHWEWEEGSSFYQEHRQQKQSTTSPTRTSTIQTIINKNIDNKNSQQRQQEHQQQKHFHYHHHQHQQQNISTTLSLDGVKVSEDVRVQLLVKRVAQCSDGQWLQVQQLSGRRKLLREDQVAKGDGQLRL